MTESTECTPGREEPAHQHVHGVVQGGGEQHPLALRRGGLHQPPHDRQEAEVGHVVGLVEHADLDIAQVAVPLLDEVLEPARTGHDDVHPVAQRLDLRVLPGTAEDGRHRQVHGLGQRHEHGLDLAGQFAGGHQDQATRLARTGVPVGQPGDQRNRETERLARAGPAAAQDVPPGQRIRQRGRLDRERHGDAGPGQHLDQGAGHAQVSEAGIQRGRAGQAVGLAGCPGHALRRGLRVACGVAGWLAHGGRRPRPGRAAPPPARRGVFDGKSCHR